MADIIRLVKGDELPNIIITLTDDVANTVLDVSAGTTIVKVKFKAVGGTSTLNTITCTNLTDGTDGKVQFNFSGNVLNVDPGEYEGEIIVDFNGQLQTVYDVLRFRVRENFSDTTPTTTTYTVTVASGNLYGGGTGNVFYLNGSSNPVLNFVRGNTYIFDQSDGTNSGHPLHFKNSSGSQYTTGVTVTGTAGQAGAKVTIVVPLTGALPTQYYCTVHGNGMGNVIS
tara:strand:+ start:294 stop:971 length:678 start_codon:yes stop_codon:yes gene_type:complete